MRYSIRKARGVVILDIEGNIQLGEGENKIKQAVDNLIEQGDKNVVLNLAKVAYMDSSGLGEIIRCFTTLRKSGGNLVLLSPSQRIIDLLSITKLHSVFDWYNDESSALKSFNNQ